MKQYVGHKKGFAKWIFNVFILSPFMLCVYFLRGLGRIFHLTYQEISVIFNLYIQGGILALSGFLPLIAQVYVTCHQSTVLNVFLVLMMAVYSSIYVIGYICLLKHFPKPMEKSFQRCVLDLNQLSSVLHISYWAVNLIIFVLWWLVLVGLNLLISHQIFHFVQ